MGEVKGINGEGMKLFCNASTFPQGIVFCYTPEVTVESYPDELYSGRWQTSLISADTKGWCHQYGIDVKVAVADVKESKRAAVQIATKMKLLKIMTINLANKAVTI